MEHMLDEVLAKLLARTVEFEACLLAQFPDGQLHLAVPEPRHEAAAAAALIAVEHAAALRAAAQVGAMNSAAAILRLQYEAVLRAAWLLFAAGPGQVDKLTKALDLDAEQAAKNVPGYLDMLNAIERAAPAGLALPLVEFNRYSRHALNSFVHAGIHPLTRARGGFPAELAEAVLRFSAAMLHFAYRLMAALTGSRQRMDKVTRVYATFADCLPIAAATTSCNADQRVNRLGEQKAP
jgi:hypothetical protein